LAAARFVWWREAGGGVGAGAPPAHPVPRALAAAVSAAASAGRPHPSPTALRYRLGRLADARAGLAASPPGEPSPFATVEAAEAYASDTAGALCALHLAFALDPATVPPPTAADADHAASHAGTGAGLAALLRGIPHAAARRRCHLPGEVMEGAGLRAEALFRLAAAVLGGGEGEATTPDPVTVAALRDATYSLACVARGHLDAASRLAAGGLPRSAVVPALLPAVGARRFLASLEAAGFDPLALVHRAGGRGVGGGVGLHVATKWALVRGRV
jgi:NADH dehydrogenase [ubiquinone] 1 alpha subcomplex assembly factor 6